MKKFFHGYNSIRQDLLPTAEHHCDAIDRIKGINFLYRMKKVGRVASTTKIEIAGGFGTRNRPQSHNGKEKSTNLSVGAFGGDKRDRTADLLNAIQALSQLSYTPISGVSLKTA